MIFGTSCSVKSAHTEPEKIPPSDFFFFFFVFEGRLDIIQLDRRVLLYFIFLADFWPIFRDYRLAGKRPPPSTTTTTYFISFSKRIKKKKKRRHIILYVERFRKNGWVLFFSSKYQRKYFSIRVYNIVLNENRSFSGFFFNAFLLHHYVRIVFTPQYITRVLRCDYHIRTHIRARALEFQRDVGVDKHQRFSSSWCSTTRGRGFTNGVDSSPPRDNDAKAAGGDWVSSSEGRVYFYYVQMSGGIFLSLSLLSLNVSALSTLPRTIIYCIIFEEKKKWHEILLFYIYIYT